MKQNHKPRVLNAAVLVLHQALLVRNGLDLALARVPHHQDGDAQYKPDHAKVQEKVQAVGLLDCGCGKLLNIYLVVCNKFKMVLFFQ